MWAICAPWSSNSNARSAIDCSPAILQNEKTEPPQQYTPTKIKISDPPNKDFSEFFTPHPPPSWKGVHALTSVSAGNGGFGSRMSYKKIIHNSVKNLYFDEIKSSWKLMTSSCYLQKKKLNLILSMASAGLVFAQIGF